MRFLRLTVGVTLTLLAVCAALVLPATAASALPPEGPPRPCFVDQHHAVTGKTISAANYKTCGAGEPQPSSVAIQIKSCNANGCRFQTTKSGLGHITQGCDPFGEVFTWRVKFGGAVSPSFQC